MRHISTKLCKWMIGLQATASRATLGAGWMIPRWNLESYDLDAAVSSAIGQRVLYLHPANQSIKHGLVGRSADRAFVTVDRVSMDYGDSLCATMYP